MQKTTKQMPSRTSAGSSSPPPALTLGPSAATARPVEDARGMMACMSGGCRRASALKSLMSSQLSLNNNLVGYDDLIFEKGTFCKRTPIVELIKFSSGSKNVLRNRAAPWSRNTKSKIGKSRVERLARIVLCPISWGNVTIGYETPRRDITFT